ncbi:MAG: DUF2029 domain-containing protein [Actinobacteria bacterium]|nr:DUF2029 domain-containing protein [Actinomycetota bacterium]
MRRGRDGLRRLIIALALAAAVGLSLWGMVEDVHNTREYGGVDLRNRVVGARLLGEGLDPYYFKWSEEYPDTLLDPMDNPDNAVSRITVPPTLLVLHLPLSGLPYATQRTLWLMGQWLLLLASIYLFARCAPSRSVAALVWIAGLLLSATPFWRFHVERGQVYALYAFLVALSYWSCMRLQARRSAAFAGGLILGALAALRPTFIFMAVPLLVFGKWRICAGMACGLVVLVLICAPFTGISTWRSYVRAMRQHEGDNIGVNQPIGSPYTDRVIEGMDNLGAYMQYPPVNTSVQWYFRYRFQVDVMGGPLVLMMAAAVLLLAFITLPFRGRAASMAAIYMMGSLTVLVSEYFLPAVKPSYVNILWLLPVEFAVLEGRSIASLKRWKWMAASLVLSAGIYFNVAVFRYGGDALLAESLVLAAFLWTALCLLQESPGKASGRRAASSEKQVLEAWQLFGDGLVEKLS